LSAIAFSLASTVRGETERASTAADGTRAYYLASGSIDRAILWIFWGMQGFSNPDGSPRFYKAPMPRLAFQYASGIAMVEVIPEAGKLNVNTATPQDLERILLSLGADPDRARSVTLAIVQAAVKHQGSGWDYTLDDLRRYYEGVVTRLKSSRPSTASRRIVSISAGF
jgi:general secretion pathway protein K